MNFIPVCLMGNESLICACGQVNNTYAYIVYTNKNINSMNGTAYVRCKKCLRKEIVEEDITLLEGVLGQ